MNTEISDYDDRIMSFLGNSEHEAIVRIVANPEELEATLTRSSFSMPEGLTPDTPEALEAAMAEEARDDRAEQMIYRLLKENPETWVSFMETVRKLTQNDEWIMRPLERYNLPSLFE